MGILLNPDTKETRYALQQLARENEKMRLMEDIRFDLAVCEIEGFPKDEYLLDLLKLIKGFTDKIKA